MKRQGLILLLIFSAFQMNVYAQKWLNHSIDLKNIQEVVNTYQMFNEEHQKVGSMIFGFWREDGKIIARDTSQFDDGSVYETAEFVYDISGSQLTSDHTSMKTPNIDVDIDLSFNNKLAQGNIEVKRAAGENSLIPVNEKYDYDVVRGEIYMLLHGLELPKKYTVSFKALVTTGMVISSAQIYYEGEESVTTPLGKFQCDVFWLKADGKMPDNKIWISKASPRTIVKFSVPSASLTIELVSQRDSAKD